MLTFYIYADFGIRRSYGYIVLLLAVLFLTVLGRTVNLNSKYRFWYWLLILPGAIFSILPNAYKTDNTMAITIYMLVSGVVFLFARTDKTEINTVLKWIELAAVLIALYIIVVKIFPSIYWGIISPRLITSTREYCSRLIRMGYGVPIGGSTTYADYIIAISLLGNFARILFGKERKKINIWFVIKIAIFITAILFENRRSEIFALIATFLILYILSLDTRHRTDFLKKLGGFVVVIALFAIGLVILSRTGHLARFEEVFQKLLLREAYSQDVTGGRFALWEKAWVLFKENSLLGIGWEQFINNNLYRHDVHNTYLQWLCETGIVGFILIFVPMLRLFFLSLRDVQLMIKEEIASSDVMTMGVIGLGMQLFFIMINIVDPAFYHLNYFCFFCLALILSESAGKLYNQER